MSEWRVLRRYEGEHLREIAMPIGGIGTGFFCLDGRGRLVDWQLMSRPNRGWRPMYSHLLLWTKQRDEKKLRVLEGDLEYGRAGDSGQPEVLAGLPRMGHPIFESTYPFGRVTLGTGGTPVKVSIEGFNPLIPGSTDDSSLPFALLTIKLTNTSKESVDTTVTFLGSNFVGTDGIGSDLKDNVTESVDIAGWKGMYWAKAREVRDPRVGTMSVLADTAEVTVARRWKFRDRGWNGEQLGIIDELLEKGFIEDDEPEKPCPPSPGDTWDSSIHAHCSLRPNESRTVQVLITWHFPHRNMKEYGWDWQGGDDGLVGNHYALPFRDSLDVAGKVAPRLTELRRKTQAFTESVLNRKVPDSLKEAALFNLATLNSHTCFRTDDGTFMASEGCAGRSGCCSGSCTHVWNYEESTVNLFPDLHRSMLESHLKNGMMSNGAERFRLSLPLAKQSWNGAAADGQMGLIVRVYEQYLKDKDLEWLKTYYPVAKRMLEFAWVPNGWDADKDGVMEGSQHNTYDVEFFGPNPMCTSYYLAAMAAVEKMANMLGDHSTSTELQALRQKGSEWVDHNLFNGEYYEQRVRPFSGTPAEHSTLGDEWSKSEPAFQIGKGCLVDQLVGQYKANRVGLGDLFDRYHIKAAVHSVFKYNYKEDFRDHYNNMRTFATGDEKGTLIASYPHGGRPEVPFPYWGECMTGFEYQAAVLLLDYGFKSEGVKVAQAVRERHNGKARNPFNEPECGSYYARAMAAWALLEAYEKAD